MTDTDETATQGRSLDGQLPIPAQGGTVAEWRYMAEMERRFNSAENAVVYERLIAKAEAAK